MPLLAAAVAALLRIFLIGSVLKVMGFLGIATITYVGATNLIDYAEQQLQSAYGQLPGSLIAFLQLLQVDYAIAILFAAFTFRVSYGLATRFGPRLPNGTPGVSNGG